MNIGNNNVIIGFSVNKFLMAFDGLELDGSHHIEYIAQVMRVQGLTLDMVQWSPMAWQQARKQLSDIAHRMGVDHINQAWDNLLDSDGYVQH